MRKIRIRSKNSRPRQLSQWLTQSDTTRSLLEDIREQQRLLSLVRACLPADLARHCSGVRRSSVRLNLYCESPVWASRLRFTTAKLLSDVRREHPGIASIQVKTRPQQPLLHTSKPRTHKPRSQQAATAVAQAARCVADTALADAILNLAKVLRRPTD